MVGAAGGPHPLLSRPDVGRDIRKGEVRVAERQQCGGSDGDVTGEVSGLEGGHGRRGLLLGGWEEDKVDSRVGQPGRQLYSFVLFLPFLFQSSR